MSNFGPPDLYPACLVKRLECGNFPNNRASRLAAHRIAVKNLRPCLKAGDRIRAVRGECGCGPETYTFAGWDGGWIVTASGINTIIPASITSINGAAVSQ